MIRKNSSTKDIIIETARPIFAQKGYKGATTAEIAKNANISEGTIYRHFESKEELMMECVKPVLEHMLKVTEKHFFKEADSLRKLIYKGMEMRLQLFEENYDTFRIIFNEIPYSKEMLDEYMRFLLDQEEKLSVMIGQMERLGKIRRSRNILLFAQGQYMALWAYINFKDWLETKDISFTEDMFNMSKEHILDDMTDYFMYGISGETNEFLTED